MCALCGIRDGPQLVRRYVTVFQPSLGAHFAECLELAMDGALLCYTFEPRAETAFARRALSDASASQKLARNEMSPNATCREQDKGDEQGEGPQQGAPTRRA